MPKTKQEPRTRDIIARNITIILAVRGMKPKDLAKRLNVTDNCVGKWLRGENDMGVDRLGMIAQILHTTPAALLSDPEEVAENCTRLIC